MPEIRSLKFVRVSARDNVAVLPGGGAAGRSVAGISLREDVPPFHKVALARVKEGEAVIKYGVPIGEASRDIEPGEWVHVHNTRGFTRAWTERSALPARDAASRGMKFMGFRRSGKNRPGIRNSLWVIPLCVGVVSELRYILSAYRKPYWIDSVQLTDCRLGTHGGDADLFGDTLTELSGNPNAAGVLFAGLENEYPHPRDVCERAQAEGCRAMSAVMDRGGDDIVPRLLDDLAAASVRVREEFPVSELCVGVTAGDGISALTANPVLGFFTDWLCGEGGTVLAAGVPEIFRSAAVANRVAPGDVFAEYMRRAARFADGSSLPDYPGRRRNVWSDGVSTPEESALSALPINGSSPVSGFAGHMGDARPGVVITPWAGSPVFDCTAFVSSGAQIILFAAEHETPFGSVVPTVKISSLAGTARERPDWTDFDAGNVLEGESAKDAASALASHALRVACGEKCSHEKRGGGVIA